MATQPPNTPRTNTPQPTASAAGAAKPGPVIPKPAAATATPPSGQPTSTAPAAAAPAAPGRSWAAGLIKQTPAWAVSMLVHVVVLLSMALIVNEVPKTEAPRLITASAPEVDESFEEFAEEDIPQEMSSPEEQVTEVLALSEATNVEQVAIVSATDELDAAPVAVELSDFGTEAVAAGDLLESVGGASGKAAAGGLGGRTDAKMREQLIQTGGGNKASEAAVEAGLKWLVQHQMPDGGWSFDLKQCPSCNGQCSHGVDKGFALDRCGATSMALLPFLGRGYTHKDGPYKKQFEAGLYFLASMTVQGQGKSYGKGGNMYSQGLAGIVLSESYAMTQDRRLKIPAQAALNFIMNAQDPAGGGWRYAPKQPGDTSAVGWQLMALKSGHMAFLEVSPLTIKKAVKFLEHVQADEGASYGYTDPGNGPATSAVGLLCRMYLGWKKDNPALQRGADRLAKMGPSKDLYHDYYATQVLHHLEGERWVGWNNRMRDMLVNSQAKKGHETGSWYDGVDGGHGAHAAGRLYCTALGTMILEVYYRHLPIYGQNSVDEEFKE